jgi:hypothetical protein
VDVKRKIVTRLPLEELWREDGFKTTERVNSLSEEEICRLLRSGPLQFVVVNVGSAPRWVELNKCFEFWKNEVLPHLAKNSHAILNDYPDQYCYFASQWNGENEPIIVLEKHH